MLVTRIFSFDHVSAKEIAKGLQAYRKSLRAVAKRQAPNGIFRPLRRARRG